MKKPLDRVSFYLLYRGDHETGTACFDDITLKVYTVPTVSTGTIKKKSEKVYVQESSVQDSKLTAEYAHTHAYQK